MDGIFIDNDGNILNLKYVVKIVKHTIDHDDKTIKAYLKDSDTGFYITTKKRLSDLETKNVLKKIGQLLEKGKKVIYEEELYE